MNSLEELDLITTLLKKYNLPFSPILDYAISEKKEEFKKSENSEDKVILSSDAGCKQDKNTSQNQVKTPMCFSDFGSDRYLRYVSDFCVDALIDYGENCNPRDVEVVRRLLLGEKKEVIAVSLNLTTERIRQLSISVIKHIKENHRLVNEDIPKLKKEVNALLVENLLLKNQINNIKNREVQESVISLDQDSVAVQLLSIPISKLNISVRANNVLTHSTCKVFGDIPLLTEKDFFSIRNCGRGTVSELEQLLKKFDLHLGMSNYELLSALKDKTEIDISSILISSNDTRISDLLEEPKSNEDCSDNIQFNDKHSFDNDIIVGNDNLKEDKTDIVSTQSTFPLQENPINRDGYPWYIDEENQIRSLYNAGYDISDIAKSQGRTKNAIKSRLEILGIIKKTTVNENILRKQQNLKAKKLCEKYYYPIQGKIFKIGSNIYEIYISEQNDLIISELTFNIDTLSEIEKKTRFLPKDEIESSFDSYWINKKIAVIAKIAHNSPGFYALNYYDIDKIVGIEVSRGYYSVIEIIHDGCRRFIDYNGNLFNSKNAIICIENKEVAKTHNYLKSPSFYVNEYIRLKMYSVKQLNGNKYQTIVYKDSDLGKLLRMGTVNDIVMIDSAYIIAKSYNAETKDYQLNLYYRDGVSLNNNSKSMAKDESQKLYHLFIKRYQEISNTINSKNEKKRFQVQYDFIEKNLFKYDQISFEDEIHLDQLIQKSNNR